MFYVDKLYVFMLRKSIEGGVVDTGNEDLLVFVYVCLFYWILWRLVI